MGSKKQAIESAEEFLGLLQKSELFIEEVWEDLLQTIGSSTDPQRMAAKLVEARWLTKWQAEQLLAGRHKMQFGEYELLRCLGRGTMGAVFKAQSTEFPEPVAIKIMSVQVLKKPSAVARFQREMRTTSVLNNEHIVRFVDAGKEGSTYFIAMEYVRGRDLGCWIKKGRVRADVACECIRQAAIGLQHAYSKGMVHRDIKPANILVELDENKFPNVKILDMGFAKYIDEFALEAEITKPGVLVGTPDYIPPENVLEPGRLDIRGDIYSLGCTLYKMLTQQKPFPGKSSQDRLMKRIRLEFPDVRETVPEISAGLAQVLNKMCARKPELRYQEPVEVIRALAPYCLRKHKPTVIPSSENLWQRVKELVTFQFLRA